MERYALGGDKKVGSVATDRTENAMSVQKGTLDRSLFGRAQARIQESRFFFIEDRGAGDTATAAKQLRSLLTKDGNAFTADTSPRTVVLLRGAVQKALGYAASPTDVNLPRFVAMFAARLHDGGGWGESMRPESAKFCGYIATRNIDHIKIDKS